MSFQFWQNETMTESVAEITPIRFNQNSEYQDFVFYFGSPDSSLILQTRDNPGSDSVSLTPQSTIAQWRSGRNYSTGAHVLANGNMYQSLNTGVSGSNVPSWGGQKGEVVPDNNLNWQCLGKAYTPDAIKMALSEYGLYNAKGGASINLGSRVLGGASITLHIRVMSQVSDVYSLPLLAQIGLFLNDCEAVSA